MTEDDKDHVYDQLATAAVVVSLVLIAFILVLALGVIELGPSKQPVAKRVQAAASQPVLKQGE